MRIKLENSVQPYNSAVVKQGIKMLMLTFVYKINSTINTLLSKTFINAVHVYKRCRKYRASTV